MAAPTEIVIDQWSPLSHKEWMGQPNDPRGSALARTWVPDHERRRLTAYLIRAAYAGNVGRLALPSAVTDTDRAEHREYGDVHTFIDRVASAVLGDGWEIVVDGADDDLADGPRLPDKPEPYTGDDVLAKRIAAGRLKMWEAQATAAVDEWEARIATQPDAQARQDALRAWADRVSFAAVMHEAEHEAGKLGDTVIVLWPRPGDWPLPEVWDPGAYFPVLTDLDRGAFPSELHLCYEFEAPGDDGQPERFLRRLTWEITDLTAEQIAVGRRGEIAWRGPDGMPLPEGEAPQLPASDSFDGEGRIRRQLPWHEEGEYTYETCVYSEGVWPMADVGAKFDALDDDKARWLSWRHDLGFDFINVIHRPNTPAGSAHFGDATMDAVWQLVDDLATLDTRTMEATQFLAGPAIGVSGANVDGMVLAPKRAYGLGEKGRMDVLDLSAGTDKLYTGVDRLRDRLQQNTALPGELVGRPDDTSKSGVHAQLKQTPFAQLIKSMRLPRGPKDQILLRMVQRMAQVAVNADETPVLEAGPTPVARIAYGPFLPSDLAGIIEQVAKLLTAKAVSRKTAVSMLADAGLPIDDASAEVDRICAGDFEGAKALGDAVNSDQAAADYLGIDLPAAAGVPPVVDLPPAGA